NPNFLILDEPTNDLDIFTLNILEDFLLDLQVNLIIVSHDRFFMDKLVDHLFVIKENGVVQDFPGNYSTYRAGEGTFFEIKEVEQAKKVEKVTQEQKASDNKISYEDRKILKKLEASIANWEQKKANLEAELLTLADDYQKIIAKQKEIDEAAAKLEEKEMEWLELSERLSE
ncbi:MAG: ABC transporter ATP-binding protein, partial [Chitinophagales bacterium]